MVTLPYLTPYVFTPARLVAPTALLGVMTAEWLATGYGFGGLMNEARGNLDYGMIWAVAFITVSVANHVTCRSSLVKRGRNCSEVHSRKRQARTRRL